MFNTTWMVNIEVYITLCANGCLGADQAKHKVSIAGEDMNNGSGML